AGRGRTALDVRTGGVELAHDPWEQVVVVPVTPGGAAERFLPAPAHEAPEVLVPPVPQHQCRVWHEAGRVVAGPGLELAAMRSLLGVGRAGEEEVLPDEDPGGVAGVVERVVLVDATAPDAEQVEVRTDGLVDPAGVSLGRDPGEEVIVRDPVGSFGEDRGAV